MFVDANGDRASRECTKTCISFKLSKQIANLNKIYVFTIKSAFSVRSVLSNRVNFQNQYFFV